MAGGSLYQVRAMTNTLATITPMMKASNLGDMMMRAHMRLNRDWPCGLPCRPRDARRRRNAEVPTQPHHAGKPLPCHKPDAHLLSQLCQHHPTHVACPGLTPTTQGLTSGFNRARTLFSSTHWDCSLVKKAVPVWLSILMRVNWKNTTLWERRGEKGEFHTVKWKNTPLRRPDRVGQGSRRPRAPPAAVSEGHDLPSCVPRPARPSPNIHVHHAEPDDVDEGDEVEHGPVVRPGHRLLVGLARRHGQAQEVGEAVLVGKNEEDDERVTEIVEVEEAVAPNALGHGPCEARERDV